VLTRRAFAGLLGAAAAGLIVPGVLAPPERRVWQVPANAPVGGRPRLYRDVDEMFRERYGAFEAPTADEANAFVRDMQVRIETLLRQDALYRNMSLVYGAEVTVTPRVWVPGLWAGLQARGQAIGK
jgi:hypothetical protein